MRSARRAALSWSPAVLLVAAGAGFLIARLTEPMVHNRYFPWIVGRGLGLAAYLDLVALCILGLWFRHPWRLRWPLLHPETALRLHAALAGAMVVLVAGHLASLASDQYAGVGWIGTVLPGAATYRPLAVGIGVVSVWVMLAIGLSARLASRLVGWRWLPIHQLALPLFGAVFSHGVLAGTDTPALRSAYIATGSVVVGLALTRRLTRPLVAPLRGSAAVSADEDRHAPSTGERAPAPALVARGATTVADASAVHHASDEGWLLAWTEDNGL
jgi:hypothetical protein